MFLVKLFFFYDLLIIQYYDGWTESTLYVILFWASLLIFSRVEIRSEEIRSKNEHDSEDESVRQLEMSRHEVSKIIQQMRLKTEVHAADVKTIRLMTLSDDALDDREQSGQYRECSLGLWTALIEEYLGFRSEIWWIFCLLRPSRVDEFLIQVRRAKDRLTTLMGRFSGWISSTEMTRCSRAGTNGVRVMSSQRVIPLWVSCFFIE